MNLNLTAHTAVVTGGASGIGRATAEAFAAEGASVAIWDESPAVATVAAEIASQYSVRTIGIRVNVADEHQVNVGLSCTAESLGPVDHLVHAAAIGSGKYGFPFTNLDPGDWAKTIQVNIMGMVNIAHAVATVMIQRKQGTMVFVSSVAGQIGSPTDPPYSASKAANINFAMVVARDLAPHGIRVNTVCPGMVQTPLNKGVWQAWHDQATQEEKLTYEEWADRKIRAVTPLGEWQTPESVADMIVFLSSERTSHVTGQTINVDGGQVMHW